MIQKHPTGEWRIKCLVPDLPSPEAVIPYLYEMSDNRWYANFGPINGRFEEACKKLLTTDGQTCFVSSFSSATAAMEVVLVAKGLERGAKVLVPSLTFPATALAVIRSGYEPVLSDIDPDSYQLTPEIAKACLAKSGGEDIAAVVPVAPYGIPVDIDAWEDFQVATGVPVLVDAAAAFPVQKPGRTIPVVYSLHATKPFGIGEGGLVACGEPAVIEKARLLSNFGFEHYEIVTPGSNAKMGEYYAAVGLVQLARREELEARRAHLWQKYCDVFAGASDKVHIIGSAGYSGGYSGGTVAIPANLLIETKVPIQKVVDACITKSIQTRHWYLPPLHSQQAFASCLQLGDGEKGLPLVADRLMQHMTGLPFHNFLSDDDIEEVAAVVLKATI
ncbi:hypothetical protein GCM10017044_12520 [Kordiimonas sediminis]|uniref:DegT/DnrJ/EryC1/StrS aminotransferase family protein n=1 Tax=Kordiimonas sediminis TaxID=1735581 RepID=A0A919APQ1_9PROT|nr:aminotransferase class I/II-fold pyridoxal phosphate-dependent enzyme [Kordiimonas sediminis]GHF19399.1 hypothetical protein GCM10017044_12520 [Kordiimonas sediminis]